MTVEQAVKEAIREAIVPSVGPVSQHTSGVPFDTGDLLNSITYTVNKDGSANIRIGDGIEYNEWLNELSYSRRGWVEILTMQIATSIGMKLGGGVVQSDTEEGTVKKLF